MLYSERHALNRVHVKINPKASVLNMKCFLRDSCRLSQGGTS